MEIGDEDDEDEPPEGAQTRGCKEAKDFLFLQNRFLE